jgi:hypothetical protein
MKCSYFYPTIKPENIIIDGIIIQSGDAFENIGSKHDMTNAIK